MFKAGQAAMVAAKQFAAMKLAPLGQYLRCVAGGTAVTFAVSAPAVLGGAGVATDFAIFSMKRNTLQAAADAAALAATRELSVIGSGTSASAMAASAAASTGSPDGGPIDSIARSYVQTALADEEGVISTSVEIDDASGAVKVSVQDNWRPFFAHFLGADITPIKVSARAELVGESKVCVIALTTSGIGAVSLTKNAHLEAKGCSVYSNSTNSTGFYLGSGSSIVADVVCSAGGVYNKGAMSGTEVLTDCPAIADPLASRAKPSVGACDYQNTVISGTAATLSPGVYCGGIWVTKGGSVTFKEGNYVIKDGPFVVTDTSKVTGRNVAFYLTGLLSLIQFFDQATIDLSGAEDGPMAGLLFFEDPSVGILRIHNIRATNAYNLTGTIYLPKGNLLVDPTANVAEKSAYTAIIAKRLVVENGPSLVLNTNYGATKVPVPDGIRSAADVVLAR
jgi:Flp pilus assembly protein TadG